MNQYLKAINESLELNHKYNQHNMQLFEMMEENIILKIEKLQTELKEIQKMKPDQINRDKRYEEMKSGDNITVSNSEVVNIHTTQNISGNEKIATASKIENVTFGDN